MNFNRWTLAITAVPTTLTLTISDNWLRTSAVIYIYKVRARKKTGTGCLFQFTYCDLAMKQNICTREIYGWILYTYSLKDICG